MAFALDLSREIEHGHLKVKAAETKSDIIEPVVATRFGPENVPSLPIEGHVFVVNFHRRQQLHEVVDRHFDRILSSGQECRNSLEVGVIKVVLHPIGFAVSDVGNGHLPSTSFDLIIKENEAIIYVIVEPDIGLIYSVEDNIGITSDPFVMPSSREEIDVQVELQSVFPENIFFNELFNYILSLRISVEGNNTLELQMILRAVQTRNVDELGLDETISLHAHIRVTIYANVISHLVSFDIAIWRKKNFSVLIHFLNTFITLFHLDCCAIGERIDQKFLAYKVRTNKDLKIIRACLFVLL